MDSAVEVTGGPLSGLRVIEVGHFVAAPFSTRLLADYGADVIKVEPPGAGDPMRILGEQVDGESLWWSSISRNKTCVTLNLRKKEGQDVFLDLVKSSDVIVENFRAGQLENWGIGWDKIHEVNPRAILVRVSGFGQSGPYKDRVAFAPIGEAFGGLRHLIRDPKAPKDLPPIRASLSLGDSIASMFATVGALTAILGREKTDEGCCVDVSLYESVFALLESSVTDYGAKGIVRQPAGSTVPNLGPSNTYRTSDDVWVCIASTSDRLFARLAKAIGRPDLITHPDFDTNAKRAKNREMLDPIIAAWIATYSYDEVEKTMLNASIPASKIYSVEDCVNDPHYQSRETIVELERDDGRTVLQPNIFPKFEDIKNAPSIRWTGPKLGQHNRNVYTDLLGYDEARLEALKADNII